MKRKKLMALICAIVLTIASMPANIMAESEQIYEKAAGVNGESADVTSLSGKADITLNGTLAYDEHGRCSDKVIFNVDEPGVVFMQVIVDGCTDMTCDDYSKIILGNEDGVKLPNYRWWGINEINGNYSTVGNVWSAIAGDNGYLRWEEYLEKGTYYVMIESNKIKNYKCHIQLYPFEVSDKMDNLISSDYISTYTAGTGDFKGCILNQPWELASTLAYDTSYRNYINVIIPEDGYYKVKFAKNGITYSESELLDGIYCSSMAKSTTNLTELKNSVINGIDYSWMEYFGSGETTKYLEAGTYEVCIEGIRAMLTYHTACYNLSVEKTEAPTTKAPEVEETTTYWQDGNQGATDNNEPSQNIQNNTTNKNNVTNENNTTNKNNSTSSNKTTTSKKKKVGTVSKLWFSKITGKKLTVKWRKVSGASGYQIRYSKNKKFKKKVTKKTIKGNKRKVSLKMPGDGTTYYQVRAYKKIKGKKVYGSWSKKISIETYSFSF